MSKICISNCVHDAKVPVRANYVNLYKWPESDAEFMKSGGGRRNSAAVDSISCRQMYLRSYTFSRKESVPERTIKCFGRVAAGGKEVLMRRRRRRRRRCAVVGRVKELARAALRIVFRRVLFCGTSVDVVESVV